LSWLNDLGLQRPKMRRHTYHAIPREEAAFEGDAKCLSRGGVYRQSHDFDRDGDCFFCKARKPGSYSFLRVVED
jgi:hypothetical protein